MGKHEEHTPGLGSFVNGKFVKNGIRSVTTQESETAKAVKRFPVQKIRKKKITKGMFDEEPATNPVFPAKKYLGKNSKSR